MIFLTVFGCVVNVGLDTNNAYAKECTGQFVNPITDVCWDCLFPMTLGALELYDSGIAKDTQNLSLPACACNNSIKDESVWVYFGQFGALTKKLGIKAVPAVVKQDELSLKINEVALK